MQTKTKKEKGLILAIAGVALLIALSGVLLFLPKTPPAAAQPLPAPPLTTQPNSTNYYENTHFSLNTRGFPECPQLPAAIGIDVSAFQGQIDWQAVKQAGIEFVFIRVGYRGNTEGGIYPDAMAQTHYQGARAAGLKIGAYFYSQAIAPWEAQQEAWFVLDQIKTWQLDLPVVYDWEWVSDQARTANLTGSMLTLCTAAFCQTVAYAGLEPMIYFNQSQARNLLDLDALSQYPFWLASYQPQLDFPRRLQCWQYSCTGAVDGITGEVDLNLYFE